MNKKENLDKVLPQQIITLDDDFAVIKRFIDGEQSAFKILVSRHKEKVRNLIYLTLGQTDAIDDISQEVFISVYRKLHLFRFESQFTTWLYRITINKCRDHLRKMKIKSLFSPFSQDDENIPAPPSKVEDFDVQEIVKQGIAKLPDKLRIPLLLKDFEGLSYIEIAEAEKIEIGTVKSRIFRAREMLRKILEPYKKDLL